jgi:peptidoglycan/LPS O-acetylase OafA/YrhL
MSQEPVIPQPRRFDTLEGWRGIACLMVLAYHCGVNLRNPPFAIFGFTGVHLFFVLSGYLLFRPYASAMMQGRAIPDARSFYLRRFIRIFPPYLISLFAFVLLRWVGGSKPPTASNVGAHVFLVFNYFPQIDFFSINAVYWSLAIEMQFYLLLPIVCFIAVRLFSGRVGIRSVIMCVSAFLALGVFSRWIEVRYVARYYAAVNNSDHVRFRSVFAYLDLFGFGMGVAALQANSGEPFVKRLIRDRFSRGLLATAGLFLCIVANDWCALTTGGTWQSKGTTAYLTFFPVILCGGLSLLLLYIVTSSANGPAWLRFRVLRWAGEISYSLYLYHTGIQFFVFKLHLFRSGSYDRMAWGNAIVSLAPAVAVAILMYIFVERPSLRLAAQTRASAREVHPPTDTTELLPASTVGLPPPPSLLVS